MSVSELRARKPGTVLAMREGETEIFARSFLRSGVGSSNLFEVS